MRTNGSRQFSRLRDLAADVRVEAIQKAVADCDAAGRARLHVARGDYAWPRHYVALLDELKLHGVPDAQIAAVGFAMKRAADRTVYVGNAAPPESVGQIIAHVAREGGEAQAAAAQLIDGMTERDLMIAHDEAVDLLHAVERKLRVLDREIAQRRELRTA